MDELSKRLAALSSEQRKLLELRLKKQGLAPANAQSPTSSTPKDAGAAVPEVERDPDAWKRRTPPRGMQFSLYFFSDNGSETSDDKYRLVIDSAKFADRHGFCAVWTPERHFQDFGGLYPNPSVLSAAIAMVTERIQIRAGSVALPLHHPVRVAEEWAVVDNLSKGRAAISLASGWHPDDFLFAPGNYADRKEIMFRYIETIQSLWAGEKVKFPGLNENEVEISTLPRPIQPRLPVWVTSAGSVETWVRAGEIGANVLAALPGYSIDDLAERITVYREARARRDHNPEQGQVTIMAHTFVGDDNAAVKEKVRAPMCNYLRSYFKQFESVAAAADHITDADKDTVASIAFEQYFEASTLLGTPNKCAKLIDRLAAIGVDEMACLIDFGLDAPSVKEGLNRLNELRERYSALTGRA